MKASKSSVVVIYNCSNQLVQLQACIPGGDFYSSEAQIRIPPSRHVNLLKSHLRDDQITNLAKKGIIKILHDSEASDSREEALVS